MIERETRMINGKKVGLYREIETDLYRFSKDAVDILLEALEEVEKYRAIGTVEEIEATIKNLNKVLLEHKDKLAPYVNIGTSEEFKALKEKDTPKEPIKPNEDYGTFICPSCRGLIYTEEEFKTHKHCLLCGQKLDWQ